MKSFDEKEDCFHSDLVLMLINQQIIPKLNLRTRRDFSSSHNIIFLGTTWVSEVLSAIAYEGNTEKLKQVRMDERVPWIEMDHR